MILSTKEKRKVYIRKIGIFTISSMLAGGISAVALIPALCAMSGGRGPGDLKGLFHFTSQFKIVDFLSRFNIGAYAWNDVSSTLPNIYVGMIMLAMCMLYFFSRKINLKEKLLSGAFLFIMFLSCKLYFLNTVWHCFNEPHGSPVRYSYMISCLVILLAYRFYAASYVENEKQKVVQEDNNSKMMNIVLKSALPMVICGLVFLTLSCIVYKQYYEYLTKTKFVISIGVFALCIGIILIIQLVPRIRKYALTLLGIVCCLELVVNAYFIYSVFPFRDIDYQSDYVTTYSSAVDRVKELDTGFYRMEKTTSVTTNDPMLFNYAGISHDSSFHKFTLQEFCDNLGLTSHGSIIHYDRNAALSTDCLLGVKYLLAEEMPNSIYKPIETTAEGVTIYENPYALSPLFLADLINVDASDMDVTNMDNQPFEYQNAVFRAISGNEESIFKPCDEVVETEAQQTFEYTITAQNMEPMYAFFQAEVPYADLYVNDEKVTSLNSNSYDFYFNGLLPLGEHEVGEKVVIRIESDDENFALEQPEFFYQDVNVLAADYEELVSNRPEIKKLSNSKIEVYVNVGEIQANNGETQTNSGKPQVDTQTINRNLVFTVPYDKGWTVKIDGEKTDTAAAFNTLLAVEVPEGEHTITFSYFPSGLAVGIVVTIISILLTVLFIKKFIIFLESRG